MNVSAISATSSTGATTTASVLKSIKDEIATLKRRKVALEQQMQSISQGNLDAKTKEQKIQQIQDQIRLIDTQIQMKQMEINRATSSSAQQSSAT